MRLAEHSIIVNGSAHAAWDKLVDWRTMPDWDIFMKSVHFEEPLRVGSTGRLVLKNGHEFTLRITQLDHMKDYTDEFCIIGARFVFYHQLLQQSPEQIKIYFSIDCEGLLPFVMHRLLAREFNSQLVVLMTNFKNQLERNAASKQ
jgi:hypothetical protein